MMGFCLSLVLLFLLVHCTCALPAVTPGGSADVPQQRQRVAILKEYALTGVKNVRYETVPMSYVDASGKPIDSSKISGLKGMGAGCMDAQGKEQSSGAEYERPNGRFKYKCENGVEEVVACVGSERTKKARIAVGQTLNVDGLWHKCESHPNGSVIYTQESTCTSAGKDYHVGEEVNVGFLRLQCQADGYKVVGQVTNLSKGEKKEVDGQTHYCEEDGDQLKYYARGAGGCTKDGKEHKEGETWAQNHLHYACKNGLANITGCYIDEKRDLAVDQDVVDENSTQGGMVFRCYRLGEKIEYNEYACGFNGTPSCTPPAIEKTEDPFAAVRGKDRGFGAFSVVQHTSGSDMVAHPSTVNLQFDKTMEQS